MCIRLTGKPEAEVVVPVVGGVVVPISDTAVPRIVVPTATTVDAVRPVYDSYLYKIF